MIELSEVALNACLTIEVRCNLLGLTLYMDAGYTQLYPADTYEAFARQLLYGPHAQVVRRRALARAERVWHLHWATIGMYYVGLPPSPAELEEYLQRRADLDYEIARLTGVVP